jgi:predicted ATPase
MGTIVHGWALAEQGHKEEGIAQLRQGIAALRATRQELGRPYFLTLLAEACRQGEHVEEGMSVLTEALDITHKTGECMHQAELYRLKGMLTLQSGTSLGQVLDRSQASRDLSQARPKRVADKSKASRNKSAVTDPRPLNPDPQGEAEACFQKAIEIARRQSAKSLELRAVMSLGRLWQSQGKKKQARHMLAEIYGWFTEGFDTKDLQEAKALLDSLESYVQQRNASKVQDPGSKVQGLKSKVYE